MRRRVVGLAAAVVLALFGTLVLVAYVQSARDKAAAGEQLYPVLVVSRPIAKGTAATAIAGSVKTVSVPSNVRANGSVTDVASLRDLVTAVDLVPGEQLLASRFVAAQDAPGGIVPPDKLRVTLSLEPERVLGGELQPGATVAVVTSFDKDPSGSDGAPAPATSHLILHHVVVTAIQGAPGPGPSAAKTQSSQGGQSADPAPTQKILVTLALDAGSVERVVFAAEHGKVWLAAEPNAAPEDGTRIVTRENVFQ